MSAIRFEGINRRGISSGGAAMVDNLAAFVEDRFVGGWRQLTVQSDGREVGGIGPHPDSNTRTWWADQERGKAGTE